MATTVQTIIELATVASTANDPGKLATDAELIAVLNRQYQAYSAMMALAFPDRWQTTAAITWAGSPAAYTLATDIIDLRYLETSGGSPISIIPVAERRNSWHAAPCVFRQGGTLVSRALTGDPAATETATLWYLDAPAALTALANSLDTRFPVRHEPLLVAELALYLANKDEGRSSEDRKLAQARREEALTLFRSEFAAVPALTESPQTGGKA